MRAITRPKLLDVAVGHAGDVVGDGAGQALGGDLRLVIGGSRLGSAIRTAKSSSTTSVGVFVRLFHPGGVVEVGIEKLLAAARSLPWPG